MAKKKEFDWYRRLVSAETFFKRPDVLSEIEICSMDCAEFIQQNRGSYTEAAHLRPNEPWWPKLNRTEDLSTIETRRMNLRWKVWEHGIFDLCRKLEPKLEFTIDPFVRLLNGDTFGISMNLDARKRVENSTISLTKFAKLYGYSEKSSDDKARDNKLIPLVELGILSARFKGQWAISIGPVGSAYFKNVYHPAVQNISSNPDQ